MLDITPIHSPVQRLKHPLFAQYNLHVSVKRDDLIHPIISGNKWRKLKYNLQFAKTAGYKGVISFGGAYSNHIHALAYACFQQQLPSIAFIRGESHYAANATLKQAISWGMKCKFLDRESYKKRSDNTFIDHIQQQYPEYFIIPEGGTNFHALKGVQELCHELNSQVEFDTIITPVGSAGTISGLITGDMQQHQILGIAVLKQAGYLRDDIKSLLLEHNCNAKNWQLLTAYHGGGYAKFDNDLLAQMRDFSQVTQLPIEPIYSGKMIVALLALIKQGFFPVGHRIVVLHTGGLQGLYGLIERKKIKADEWLLPLQS
ncbi:1-aminocyclopropane-1-carboxylate deaminase/D-cysteine desulfhydrase [Thalassotalea sediminis]|uniref:1-aminocyclopropane-1-carboxylate deaminase/D-cysteine desulfhydrase n=1 Tax=Thalassotalea sediminis TaxID=1759089 RepID=UPI002572C3CC|nr:pyridoxal-phosphate dependent enzyme [Thalassotalea sediminis]